MSDSNRIAVGLKEETTIGTAASGPYQGLNVSQVSLTAQKNTAEDNTIRADRNLRNTIMTSLVPQGGLNFDFIYGNLSTIIPGVMGNAMSTPVSLSGTAVTIAGAVITADAGTPFSDVAKGQWLRIKIGTTNYLGRVASIGGSGASMTMSNVTLPAGAATLAQVRGSYVRNGTTMKSYSIEKHHQDLTTKGFFAFLGMVPNTFNLQAQSETIVTGDVQFMGMTAQAPTDTSISGASYSSPVTNESFAGLSGNIGTFIVGGSLIAPTDMAIRGLNLSINNNVRRDAAINITEMGWGQFTVTGQLSTYFKGGMAAVDAFYEHADSSASYAMTDPQGNIAVITALNLKFTNFTANVGGKNQAVMGDLDFTGKVDSTYGATLQLDFIPAA